MQFDGSLTVWLPEEIRHVFLGLFFKLLVQGSEKVLACNGTSEMQDMFIHRSTDLHAGTVPAFAVMSFLPWLFLPLA